MCRHAGQVQIVTRVYGWLGCMHTAGQAGLHAAIRGGRQDALFSYQFAEVFELAVEVAKYFDGRAEPQQRRLSP